MHKAFEYEVERNRDGKWVRKKWSLGPIVVWALITLAALLSGKALVSIPPGFWSLAGR
jgi:hypothetical protein